jgi:hypothetical protein
MTPILAGLLVVVSMLLTSCGQVQEQREENWYSSAVWSPDGTEVAYFKRHVEYVHSEPRVSLFIGEETKTNVLNHDRLFLCVNDATGESERILKKVELPAFQSDPYVIPRIYTAIVWDEQYIRYGAGKRDIFSTGVRQITPQGISDQLIEPGFEPVFALRPGPTVLLKRELYSGAGDYGYFGNRTIYVFDHNLHEVKLYLHDPLDREIPYTPPYSVTGSIVGYQNQ